MPHIILETGGHLEKLDVITLFKDIHHGLNTFANIESCKSRHLTTSNPFVGSGSAKRTFAHITLLLLPGRTDTQKNQLRKTILTLLEKHVVPLSKENGASVDLSIRIEELHTYEKRTVPVSFSGSEASSG